MRLVKVGSVLGESLSCHGLLCPKPLGVAVRRRPSSGGGDGGSGRVCEISELTLGAGLRKPGFPLSGVLGHAPKRALGRDLRQAGAPVPGVGAAVDTASFTVWLIILLQVRGGAHDSPETEGFGQGLLRH